MNPQVQTDPQNASTDEINKEIKFLRRLEKKYGSHGLRLAMILKLNAELLNRNESYK